VSTIAPFFYSYLSVSYLFSTITFAASSGSAAEGLELAFYSASSLLTFNS
jgi:hypothetical protein